MLSPEDFRPQQPPAIDFLYQGDQSLLLGDVGTGKTLIAQTVLQDWIVEGICDRALALCPKRVATEVWPTEHEDWTHLDPGILAIGVLAGTALKKRIKLIEDPDVKILVCNYELLPWLMEWYPEGLPGVNVLVADEIDKLKDHKTKRFKGVPRRRDKKTKQQLPPIPGMNTWREVFEIHIGMTGTPVPRHLLNLWAQVFVIDGGKRLGDNFYEFRQRHFMQTDWAGYKFEPLPGREAWIYEQIADICHRVTSTQGVDTPNVIELPVRWLDMPRSADAKYKELERNYIIWLRQKIEGREDDGEEVIAEGEAALYGKLRQICQGFAYLGDADDKVRDSEWLFKDKYNELDSLISELQGQQLMIVYHFKEQLAELQRRYPHLKYLGGGVSDAQARATMKEWNDGDLQLLALHPMSAGHGLNLQKSAAHHIVLLTLPETAGLYQQVIGRLARGGNLADAVYVHRILMRGTTEEERDAIVHGMITTQDELLAAMEVRTHAR